MTSDSLLINIQLAIMGVVLVAGLFYLWRMIYRVEKKVDEFIESYAIQQPLQVAPPPKPVGVPPSQVSIDEADNFMNEVFGAAKSSIVISTAPATNSAPTVPSVHVEEDTNKDTVSEAGTHVSKSKLKKMSMEALKDVCKEKGLSTDGTKTALMERISATLDDNDA